MFIETRYPPFPSPGGAAGDVCLNRGLNGLNDYTDKNKNEPPNPPNPPCQGGTLAAGLGNGEND